MIKELRSLLLNVQLETKEEVSKKSEKKATFLETEESSEVIDDDKITERTFG